MGLYETICNYQEAIIGIYREQQLTCLSGLDQKFLLNGRNILSWHLEVVSKAAQSNRSFQYNKNMDDIFFCSVELLFFTANLYLYRPYINNPLRDALSVGEDKVYPNYQNLAAKRYNMFADMAAQVAYNFWDRIGDLLASFFPNRLKPDRIFFPIAIGIVPEQFHRSKHFSWLRGFQENEYQGLNKKRRQVVYYTTFNTELKYKHLEGLTSEETIENLQAEKEGLADFYKQHISLTLSGYEHTLFFLEEISSELLVNMN
jgi:hypothetical protein